MHHINQCELCQYFLLSPSQCSRGLAPCQGHYVLQDKLYHSSYISQEGGTSWKKAWNYPLDTFQLHYLKHNSEIFASAMPDPALAHYDIPSILILPLGYEITCELVTQTSTT